MNWNKIILEAVTFGLDEIPVVGSLLEHIVYALWPETQEDVWEDIKDKVEALVNKKIAEDVYNDVASELGSRAHKVGLIREVMLVLDALQKIEDPIRVRGIWDTANGIFSQVGGKFQREGYELLLLPLFAQFANLHLSLLRIGCQKKWIESDDMQDIINTYSAYVDETYKAGVDEHIQSSKGSYNYVNNFKRQMVIDVLNFRDAWKYFNPANYPGKVKVTSPRDIYYTLTEQYQPAYNNDISYNAPGKLDRNLKEIQLVWLQDSYDGYNFVQGFISKYDSGTNDYEGVLWGNKMPDYNKKCNPEHAYNCFHKKDISIHSDNPVVAIQAEYEAGGAVYSLSFGFRDGTWTGYIPRTNVESYPHHFVVRPPEGYRLTSIWAPSGIGYYYGAKDVLFGFSLDPELLKTVK